jgi:hypothetical protein
MPDVGHGEALFKGLFDYPLPQQPGVRDYVFYLVATDQPGYGSAAKFFFDTFYKHHHAQTGVESLEGLIRALHTDVTQNGVEQIREIVIVAHGTPLGMNFRVLDTTSDQQMRQVTPLSLSDLQDQFSTGDAATATFADQRAVVLKHLASDAWVTLRLCRFGQSDEGMYSVYSFFGGDVNVYAPVKFQTFAGVFLRPGTRFSNRLVYHEHLVRQRFVPRGMHTPNRAEAIVRAMEDPQSFSDPFVLATRPLEGTEPPAYGHLLDGLNAASLIADLRAGFEQNGFALTAKAQAKVRVRDSAWTVTDILTEDQETYPVEYAVDEEVDVTGGQRRLVAQGKVVGDFAEVAYQTFLDKDEHERYNGELFTLAHRVDDDPADADVKQFDALSALLAANGTSGTRFATGDVDLRALLAAEDPVLEPAPTATITLVSQPAEDSLRPTIWLVGPTVENTALEIHLVHLYTDARVPVRMYKVVLHFTPDKNGVPVEQASYQQYVLSTAGTSLDSPGIELAASLDRLSIDDLVDLISFLNTPYDPERVVVLHQAQQALRRKSGFEAWLTARFPNMNDIPFPSGDPLTELSLGQKDDWQERVYPFWFDGNWREVRESVRPRPAFHDDLFLEELLTDRFANLDSWTDVVLPPEDSPAADARQTRGRLTPGQQRYATTTTEKDTFTPRDDRAGCGEFRTAVRKIKELQDLPADQFTAALAEFTTSDGTSYFHIAVEVAGTYGILRNLAFLTKVAHLPEVPSNSYELAKFIAKPIAERVGWELGVTILEFLESDIVILIPWEMWKHFLETQQEGVERNEAYGRLTGARTWLEELDDVARRNPSALTPELRIELSGRSDAEVIKAYEYELHDGVHTRFMLFIADFHHGFDEGGARMQELWPEILRASDEVMGKTLSDNSLDSCRMKVLMDEGFLDLDAVRADVVRQIVQRLLNELPHV